MKGNCVSWLAPAFVEAGIAFAALNYPQCPAARLGEIVAAVRTGLVWLHDHAAAHGLDPGRLAVAGYSSGAHLAAMALSTDWAAQGRPADMLKGGCAISGAYDLEPVRFSGQAGNLHLDHDTIRHNSPIRHVPGRAPPLVLACGGREPEEFRHQQADYAAACRGRGLAVTVIDLPGEDHFSVIDALGDPQAPLHRAVRGLLGIA